MNFDASIILNILSVSIALAVAIAGLIKWIESVKTKRAQFLNELLSVIRDDKDFDEVYYKIEYNEIWFSVDHIIEKIFEPKLDKVLIYYNYICYLRKIGLLKQKEFKIFEYQINSIITNEDTKNYFSFLKSRTPNNEKFVFEYLDEYAKTVKY